MVREIKVVETIHGRRFKVRYRLGGRDTSETFVRESDAIMFRDILGAGRGDRVAEATRWLEGRRTADAKIVPTFGQWFDGYVDQLTGVTPRTRNDYRSLHRRYLNHLDPLPLTMIARPHVTDLVNSMDNAGRSPKTIKQAVHLLSTCLRLAIDEGHIAANPCRNIRLPSTSLNEVEARFLSYEEADELVRAIPDHYRSLVVFLLGTGLRWSEATALQTKHVNIQAGTIRVERAWKRVPGEGFVVSVPKTRKAKRTVNAATMALAAAQPLLRRPADLLFTTPAGDPVRHANFYNNVWQRALLRTSLDPRPRIHDLRHTHASWLLSEGIAIEAVQDQLGHESLETTRKTYAKLIPAVGVAVGKAASAALDRALVSQTAAHDPAVGVVGVVGVEVGQRKELASLEPPVTPRLHQPASNA
ncbi:MAG: hypothetical protein CMH83_19650 [Nocardioides sp.]|nr:hypothetical protein [Nocardioides sp.]